MTDAIVVFARAPERGHVKTRLVPAVGEDGALLLHRALLGDTLEAARAAGARVLLAHTPAPPFEEQALADEAYPQRGGDFGARLDAALADARARGDGPLVVVGCDAPHVGPAALREALDALAVAPAVLGAVPPDGFWLLGFAGPPVPVRGAIKAPDEPEAVARLLAAAGAPPRRVRDAFDVDTPGDLARLAAHLAARPAWTPPRTASLLPKLHRPGGA